MLSPIQENNRICGSSENSQTQNETTEKENGVSPRVLTHDTPPSSAFIRKQKQWIILIAALAGWFSTASSFIYFPAIPFLAKDLGVSVEHINLSVTSYLIASGIFPSITGDAADKFGRRPVFVISLAVYGAINIGLAIQRSFVVLMVLRIFQSAAISGRLSCEISPIVVLRNLGTFSIAYGVIGDLTTPADRGSYTGFISILYVLELYYHILLLC